MGVYIKNMEMPHRCFSCPMCEISDTEICCCISMGSAVAYIELDEKMAIQDRPPNCPLVEVKPHGRLIDADKIPYTKIMYDASEDKFYYGVTKPYIDRMPTIIPADKDINVPIKEGET